MAGGISGLRFLHPATVLVLLTFTAWEDGKSHTIPDRYPAMLLLAGLAAPLPALIQRLFAGGIIFLLLLLLAVLLEIVAGKPSIGGGDIKLYSALGTTLVYRLNRTTTCSWMAALHWYKGPEGSSRSPWSFCIISISFNFIDERSVIMTRTKTEKSARYQVVGVKKLDERGRISLAPKILHAVGLKAGDIVLILLDSETKHLILRKTLLDTEVTNENLCRG